VTLAVNDRPVPFSMKVGEAGEAFFVVETEENVPDELLTSPLIGATEVRTLARDEGPSRARGPAAEPGARAPQPDPTDFAPFLALSSAQQAAAVDIDSPARRQPVEPLALAAGQRAAGRGRAPAQGREVRGRPWPAGRAVVVVICIAAAGRFTGAHSAWSLVLARDPFGD
jgi:hypothetical protein